MPGMNGNGPEGKGPETGRGLGKCKDANTTEDRENFARGLGRRLRAGLVKGMGRRFRNRDQQ